MTQHHIAILDDEPDITQLLATYLGSNGFRVSQRHAGAALMDLMALDAPDLVLLDLGLPGEDGFAIARHLRERWNCGLVIVSGRGDAVDKVVGLEIGADDYVTKPFDLRELLARVKAVLRRTRGDAPASGAMPLGPGSAAANQGPSHGASGAAKGSAAPADNGESFRFAGWLLDRRARVLLSADGVEVALTSGEFDLLSVFVQHPGRVLSRDFLLESTRGRKAGPFDRTVDVQVGRLRRKLEIDPQDPQILKSVRSAGYVLVSHVQGDAAH
ncbi:MAG: response regulator transcription factor [Burkholderiaceae bacterium]